MKRVKSKTTWKELYGDASEMRDQAAAKLRRAQDRIRAMGECASAAHALLAMGDIVGASVVLSTVRRSYVDSLQETVATEPGGIAYREPPPTGSGVA